MHICAGAEFRGLFQIIIGGIQYYIYIQPNYNRLGCYCVSDNYFNFIAENHLDLIRNGNCRWTIGAVPDLQNILNK
jgi:hypothetical protein